MTRVLIPAALSLSLTVACGDGAPRPGTGDDPSRAGARVLEYDVSEDMSRFLPDEGPVHEDGMPDGGMSFVTSGYLYPAGFLADAHGTLPDGSPAYPDAVVGTWTCRGYFLGAGLYETGPAVITTQTYMIYDEPGYHPEKLSQTLVVTDGFELMATDVPVTRAVVGATGELRGLSGQMEQVLRGFNDSEGVDLSVTIDLDVR